MIHFLVHEKADNVGVATVDIKAGETATARARLVIARDLTDEAAIAA